jgi:hypothetical protein
MSAFRATRQDQLSMRVEITVRDAVALELRHHEGSDA